MTLTLVRAARPVVLAAVLLPVPVTARPCRADAGKTVRVDAAPARRYFERHGEPRLVPLLQEVLRFPTMAGETQAHADQKRWLARTATAMGLTVRDAGLVTEVELPGPSGAPVLGVVIHGDVQPVDAKAWKEPPFAGVVHDGAVWGRGAADDKGPLVQCLLALQSLRETHVQRTHTIRLLVGSDEESGSTDMAAYLKDHTAPDYSLVVDGLFPAIVGEKAWNALRLSAAAPAGADPEATHAYDAVDLDAGLAPSIVPDHARLTLRWRTGEPGWAALVARLRSRTPPPDTRLEVREDGRDLVLDMAGRSAHAGVNLQGGRNALVALAQVLGDDAPSGPLGELILFARQAGSDLRGAGLDLPAPDGLWHGYDVNVATVKVVEGRPTLTINIRRPPPWTGAELKRHLARQVDAFNEAHHAALVMDPQFFFGDEPLVLDPGSPLVVRALEAYRRATGDRAEPAVIGGGTYAKRLPQAFAFGAWFPDKPYPGHDVDEHVPIVDLVRGTHVLIETFVDIATGPRIDGAVVGGLQPASRP
jgi:predicted dipeptidase